MRHINFFFGGGGGFQNGALWAGAKKFMLKKFSVLFCPLVLAIIVDEFIVSCLGYLREKY